MNAPAPQLQPRPRRFAWLVGIAVLVAVAVVLWSVLRANRPAPRAVEPPAAPATPVLAPAPAVASGSVPGAEVVRRGRRLGGFVLLPNGQPAAGATVVAYRALTAWPEWSRERLGQAAITGADGAFQIQVDLLHDVLLAFEHPQWAGGLEEVPFHRDELTLHLQPGFALSGLVTNDVGSPLANARVVVEAVLADQRRALATTTAQNGRYQFENLPAGPVRVVARHPAWQPAVRSAVVIGAAPVVDFAFERPSLPAWRGRVVAAIGQAPIAGATVELLPTNAKPGLVDPVVATSDADGVFELRGLARGTVKMTARHPGFSGVSRTLAIGPATSDLAIELPPRSRVAGQLSLAGAVPPGLAGQLLQLRDAVGEIGHALVDAEGHFEFPAPLSSGPATLALVAGAYAFQGSQGLEAPVRIDERATTRLELELAASTAVRGRVLDELGRPLAGVTVQQTRMLAENARWISDAAVSFDVGAFGSQVANLVGFERDQLLAVTAPDGGFIGRGLKPGPLLVRFDLPGRGGRWLRIDVPAAGAGEFGDVVMPPACRLTGRVRRGAAGLAGASVTFVGRESQGMVVTGGDGSFVVDDLQPGEYRVRARLPSMPTANVERTVMVAAGVATPPVELPLQPGRTVRGIVNSSDGQPVPSALVTVRGAGGQPTVTDPSGRFLLELPDRAVELQVSLGDRSARSNLRVRREQQEVEVKLDAPPQCTLEAQLAGLPGRARPSGALLRVARYEGGVLAAMATRWVETPGGELRWPFCPVGRVRIEICCDGYAPKRLERECLANEAQKLGELLLEPGCHVAGRVVDPNGAPVGNAIVLLGEEADLDLFEPLVRSAADGTFKIRGVTTDSATLVVRASGLAPQSVPLRLPQDVLGSEPLLVRLETGSVIEVEVGRLREGGLVQLRRQGRVLATAETDEAGFARFANRSPGLYTVQVYGSEEPPKPVRVERSGQRIAVRL